MANSENRIGKGVLLFTLGLSIAAGLVGAHRRAWTCDDAFISFRYALNLTEGRGLVFNPGEYVEGFTNASWTLLSAAAIFAGLEPDTAANVMGLLCFAVLLGGVLLWGRSFLSQANHAGPVLSAAALAIHVHMMIFATSGLETMCFTMLATLGVLLVIRDYSRGSGDGAPRGRTGFALLALACLTRPDGLVFYAAAGLATLYLEFRAGRVASRPAAFLFRDLPRAHIWFLILVPALLIFRLWYFGSLVPNTFYAKSAYAGYWSQGLKYLGLYFQSYWLLALLPIALGARLLLKLRHNDRTAKASNPATIIATACVLLWLLYIMRVGGDFMFARFLIPITPLLYLLLENALRDLTASASNRARALHLIFWLLLLGTLLRYDPYQGRPLPRIADITEESKIYTPERFGRLRKLALELKPKLFDAEPVLAYVGAQAGLVYYWTPLVAIESETGLTDKFIAARELQERGPIGHEKNAPISYLRKRRTSLRMRPPPADRDRGFNRLRVKDMPADWEIVVFLPRVMDKLKGDPRFQFVDFRDYLDGYMRGRPSPETVRRDLEFFRAYYFDHVRDAKRLEQLNRLAGPASRSRPRAR